MISSRCEAVEPAEDADQHEELCVGGEVSGGEAEGLLPGLVVLPLGQAGRAAVLH